MNVFDADFGLWIDDPKADVLNPGYFRTLDDHRIDTIAIMIDPSDRPWNPRWNEREIESLIKLAEAADIEVSLVTWPYPDREQLDAMADDMMRFMAAGVPAAWEVDVEFNWKHRHVRGFRNLDEAGDFLVEAMDDVCGTLGCRRELTTFMEHVENNRAADVAPHMDRLIVQAYSVNKRNGQKIGWGHRTGPGRMQRRTIGRTLQVPGVSDGRVRYGIGLAAWRQRFNGRSPTEAMQEAFTASMELNPIEIRWWSSKHVLGIRANPYAGPFIRSLRTEGVVP